MAISTINRIELFIYIALVLFLQHEIGFALKIDITPNVVNGLIHNDVSISCELENSDSDISEIMLLELSRDDVPIAILRQKEDVMVEKGMQSKFQAEGKILESVQASYIRVTLANPDIDDTGAYACQMYFLDQLHVLQNTRKLSNLTVSEHNVKSAMKYVMDRVSSLEAELARQKIDHANQLRKERELQKIGLQEQIVKVKEEIEQQNNEFKVKEATLQAQISKLENQDKVHEQNLKQVSDTASFTTAFGVEHPKKSSYARGDTILFTKSTLNVGDNYNMHTGVFTAPRKGLYVFHTLMTTAAFTYTDVRLVGGPGPWEGRVEIRRGGTYGTLCDDGFNKQNAAVICRMLGYTGGIARGHAYFGHGTGSIWLDNVKCVGNEVDVYLCQHNDWGVNNCGHGEDVSVECQHTNIPIAHQGSSHLKVNDKIVESMYTYDQRSWQSGSISTVTSLNAGDQVKPVAETRTNLRIDQQYTHFNGYLLKLL